MLYPNPGSETFSIQLPGIQMIEIYTSSGSLVFSTRAEVSDLQEIHLPETSFPPGLNFIKIFTNNGVNNFK